MSALRGERSGSGDRCRLGARPPESFRPPPSYPSRMAEPGSLTCANCSTTVPELDAEAAGWRYWSDGVGELLPFCPVCAEREFAPDAPA